jgi:uncharacterized protein (DUF1015 family)
MKKKILPILFCDFCKDELTFSHTENNKLLTVFQCNHCPILIFYYFTQELNKARTAFLLDKKEHQYFWTNNYINNCSYIIEISESSSYDGNGHLVDFPKVMEINPINIFEKFSLWMTFI